MAETTVVRIEIRERSQVAAARRRAQEAGDRVGLPTCATDRLALVVTEAATNLLKHVGQGEVLIVPSAAAEPAVSVVALDTGPGMADPAACLQDGFSTAASPGIGLGTIRRQSDRFDLYTMPNEGTVMVATVAASSTSASQPSGEARFDSAVAGLSVPVKGETACGDAWSAIDHGNRLDLLTCDGLGHGIKAAEAARAAQEAFADHCSDEDLSARFQRIHVALHHTRGAAVALASIDRSRCVVEFIGIGNIAGLLQWQGGSSRTLSYEGIVGRDIARARIVEYPFEGELLAMFTSDGIVSRWDIERYRGLVSRDAMTIAAVLYRDFRRLRDDATVVVARVPCP